MEALPTMPMISPQFRTSTISYDNIPNFDFRLRMKEFILLTFNADPHDYDSAFDELAKMKFEANIPAASVEQICKLKRYYGQLCMMQKRFPMGSGEQLETPFSWHDGLIDMRSANSEVTICDIEFEKASVLFNIGTCHAQYASDQPRDTQDSIKTAFSHFQQAATAFEQLNTFRNSDFFYPSVDLDANVITFYYNVLVAQAQECIVQKSLLENRNPLVTAKLSLWLQESYEATTKIVDEWSINIPESVQRYYAKLCQLKSNIYGVIGYMAMGDHYEKEDKKMGWRLQYYNIANKYMEHLTSSYGKMRDRYPELFVACSFLFDVISAKQKNAEKENDFIYHDRIPKTEEAIDAAKKEGSVCKVTVPKFNPLDPSNCGADLFEKLLPSHVQEANDKYSEKKDEIFREMKEIIKSYDDHLHYQLQLAEFDKLKFMLTEGKNREAWFQIPEDLMQRNADMSSNSDCVPILIEKMRESSDTARVAEAKLNTLLAKLRAIDLPRLKADEGFNLIQKELERLAEAMEQAKAHNVSLNKAIAQHSANLQLLTLPCAEMWHKIVPVEDEERGSTVQSPEEAQVRKMVAKVEEMRNQRKNLLEELAADLKSDDIATKLMGTNERGAEEIMNTEIAKHTTRQSAIRLNVTAQEAILRAFADANADYHGERSGMTKKKAEFDKKVMELCASYEVYRDVVRKCEEGEQFYRQLMSRCDQFAIPVHAMEEQYREELEKKERAQKEAEHHMNQLRMSREAQSALMDFGGAPRSPAGPMGPAPPGQFPQQPSPRAPGTRGPRLGDYLDSYRARKQNPQVQIPQDDVHSQGPPSPTPSSICDFPMSSRSQRFGQPSPYGGQGQQANQFYPAQQGPGPQGPGSQGPGPQFQYSPHQAPPPMISGSQAYQQATASYPGPPSSYSVPRVVPSYDHQGSQQQYGPGQPAQPYQGPAQSNGSSPVPPGGPYQSPEVQSHRPSPVQQGPGGPYGAQNHGPSPVQGGPYQGSGAQMPPVSAYQSHGPSPVQPGGPYGVQSHGSYQSPEVQSHRPAPVQHGPSQYQAPPSHIPPVSAYGPSPVQPAQGAPFQGQGGQSHMTPPVQMGAGAQNLHHPAPIQPTSQYQGPAAQGGPYQPPSAQMPPVSAYGPSQVQQGLGGPYQGQGPQTQSHGQSPVQPGGQNQAPMGQIPFQDSRFQTPGSYQGAPSGQFQGYGAPAAAPVQPPFQVQQPIPPQQPSYQPLPPPAQPTFQHPPQGAPISAPPPPQQLHQHVAPAAPTPVVPPTSQQPAASSAFTPTPGAPSPWHATPAQLKTPWNTTPQYHAPTTPVVSGAQEARTPGPTAQPAHSNVDLLSDLLGDFNFQQQQPAPIQPTMQNNQHLQNSQTASLPPQQIHLPPQQPITMNQDFRMANSNQPDPPRQFVRPAAAVQPMPQAQPAPELSEIAQQTAPATETPILKGSPSITELADPSKFQLGEGNVQKLEKRLLHQSFSSRTNGPPPPLNQSDPLNQIDAFSFSRQK